MPAAVAKLREGVPLGTSGGYDGPWREGKYLVMSNNGPMPIACVKCGAEPTTYIRKTLTWHHPAIYLTILIGVLIYLIVAMVVRKTAKLQVPVCAACNARRKRNLAIGWLSFILSLVLCYVAVGVMDGNDEAQTWVALSSAALLLFSVIWAVGIQFILAKKITDQFVWIKKVGKEMLEPLPEFPGV
jgi:hypothetical protein